MVDIRDVLKTIDHEKIFKILNIFDESIFQIKPTKMELSIIIKTIVNWETAMISGNAHLANIVAAYVESEKSAEKSGLYG